MRYEGRYSLISADLIGHPLTRMQKQIIEDINNGAEIITDSSVPGAIISGKDKQYDISGRTFWNMVRKGAIAQELCSPFYYIVTNDFKK